MKPSRLRPLKRIASLTTTLCVFTSLLHAEAENWQSKAKSMMGQPLSVRMETNGNKSRINLVEIQNGQLIFTLQGQSGEASMPLNSLGDIWFADATKENYTKTVGLLGSDQLAPKHLKVLREMGYPRIQFLEIPQQNCAFQKSAQNLLEGLIQLNQFNEAIFLVDQLDMDTLGPDFEKHAIQLAAQLVGNEQEAEAIALIPKISIERIDATNLDFILKLAHSLRKQGSLTSAKGIYTKIANNPNSSGHEATYWAYYCGIQSDEHLDDHSFATTIDQIQPGEESFPLQQLILGIYYTKREQTKEAMRAISQGIAYAKPTETWTPELMYRSAKLYEQFEMPDIALSVYQETILFFPTTKWAQAAQTHIN